MLFAHSRMLLLAAIAVALLLLFFWWTWRKRLQLTQQFVQSRLLAQLTVGVSRSAQKLRMGLLVAAVTLLFVALARPMWGQTTEEVRQRGLDIIVAIDTSRSMLAEDVSPNRLARAKLAALDLMQLAKRDRLGLVAFAGSAFLQCPLTLDEEAFRQSVNAIDVGIIPQGGSVLAEAIETALDAFKAEGENFKVLVMFTDGEDHETGALDAAEKAAGKGMRIFTVGVGTASGELLPVRDEQGRRVFVKDEQGHVVKSRLNEKLLTQIATATGGFYLGLSGANTMDVLYRQGLEPLPRSETATKMIRQHKDQYMWPLSFAIGLLLLEVFWPERKRIEKPATAISSGNEDLRKAVAALVICLVAFQAAASSHSALRQYEEGRFREAQQEFQRLAEKRPQDARLRYNAGAAAYQAKQFDEAAEHFMAAMDPNNLELQQHAHYNLGNTLFRVGEQQAEPPQKMASWEQAVKGYESALKLNPQDADAKFNLELVKKKLEELRPQQKQEQKKDDKQDDSKDDKNQDQQNSEQKDKQEQQKENEQKQEQQKDQQKSEQQQKEEQKQNEQKQKQENKDQPQDKNSQQANDQPENDQKKDGQSQAVPGQMTKEQVEKLLNALRSEEKAMIFRPPQDARSRNRIFRDW